MDYTPPTAEQVFALRVSAGIDELATSERFAAATPDMIEAIVGGIGAFAAGVWAPLNRTGDREGARLTPQGVTLPAGYAEAYAAYIEAGWNTIAAPAGHGGQGLPFALAACVLENLGSANMAFTLLPILSVGAIDALHHHGSEAQKAMYLPKLISGEWPGTMNLTEPQAGSDVGALPPSPSRKARMPANTASRAPRSSSPGANTSWPKTSSIWFLRGCLARRRDRAECHCSSCRAAMSCLTARRAISTTCAPSALNTNSASMPRPPAS